MRNLTSEYQDITSAIRAAFLEIGSDCDEFGCFGEDDVRDIPSEAYDGFIPFTNGGLNAMVLQDLALADGGGMRGPREEEIIRPYIESSQNDAAYDFIQCRYELECLRDVVGHDNASSVLFGYFDECETDHAERAAQYPVDMLGEPARPFWDTDTGRLREEYWEFESEYLAKGGEYWLQFRAVYFAPDNSRNLTGKPEVFFYAGVNTDFTYGRDKGLECTFERTYPVARLTPARIEVIARAMLDSL